MRFFIWRIGAANIAVYACKPHLFQINALAGPPDRRGEIFALLVYRQRVTGNHNVGAHFRVVKFIVALEKPHEAEGNAKCPNGIPCANEMNFTRPMTVFFPELGCGRALGHILPRGAFINLPGLIDQSRIGAF